MEYSSVVLELKRHRETVIEGGGDEERDRETERYRNRGRMGIETDGYRQRKRCRDTEIRKYRGSRT